MPVAVCISVSIGIIVAAGAGRGVMVVCVCMLVLVIMIMTIVMFMIVSIVSGHWFVSSRGIFYEHMHKYSYVYDSTLSGRCQEYGAKINSLPLGRLMCGKFFSSG